MTITQRQALTNAASLVRRAQSITAFVCSELARDGQQEQATIVAELTAALKRVAISLTPTKPVTPN